MSSQGRTAAGASNTSVITLALCFLVAVFEGFDLQAAGVTARLLKPFFHMSDGQLGWFFSSSTFGLMIGAAIGGRLSDRFGRKTVLIGAITAFGLMSIANGLAPSTGDLLAARFLTGVGLGGALPNLLALVAENTAPNRRNTAVAALYAGMPTGGAIASLVSLLGGAEDWRIVFFIGGLAPLVVVPLLLFKLPDSRELKQVQAQAGAEGLHPRGVLFTLIDQGRGARTLLLWIAFFLSLATMYVLLNWLPTLLGSRGLSKPDTSWVQLSFNVFGAVGSVLTGMTMDRLSLSKSVMGCFVLATVGLVLLWLSPVSLAISFFVGGLVGATISTTQALLYATAPPAYPTEVRGTGVGAAVAVGRLGSAAGPLVVGALLGSGALPQQVLMVLVPTVVVAGVAAFSLSLMIGARQRLAMAGITVH